MKLTRILWCFIGILVVWWIYYIYVSPKIFARKEVLVPDIIGLNEEEAKTELKKHKIKYNIHYMDGKSLCVESTLPKSGSKIYENHTIEVYILKPLPSYYQSFVGLLYEENIDRISSYCREHDLTYQVEYVVNNAYPSGQIITQSKSDTELVEQGSEIVFQVAVSDHYISMPNLVGLKVEQAMEILDDYELNYNLIYYHAPIAEDTIISQSISEGSILKKGNTYSFDIYVSKGMPQDITTINVYDFIQVLTDLKYNYDIIYVGSTASENILCRMEYEGRYILYITK